jgi:serine kinase of HPr protein (carbohydrate metabolism regulator)
MAVAPVHAGLAARRRGGVWSGVLLEGPSGGGKSDLLLRLRARGWSVVADDRVLLWRSGAGVYGRPPEVLQGLLEVRGVGVLRIETLAFAPVDVVVSCRAQGPALERAPDPGVRQILGVRLPRLELDSREASAADKLEAFCGHERL